MQFTALTKEKDDENTSKQSPDSLSIICDEYVACLGVYRRGVAMINLQKKSAIAAAVYAETTVVKHLSPAMRSCAEEDFQAGYIAATQKYEEQFLFMHRQLHQIKELAEQYNEQCSLSIAIYTIERVR